MKVKIFQKFFIYCYCFIPLSFISCSNSSDNKIHSKNTSTHFEIIAEVKSPMPDMSGIAVTKDNRIFVSFPRHADNHTNIVLAEYKNGKFIPYPNKQFVSLPQDESKVSYSDWLVSPHGITLDSKGNLWVIDDGKRAGVKEIPNGAAKLVGIDTKNNKIIANITIPINPSVHLNDLRFDNSLGEKGVAFITNSSFGTTPSLFVVDVSKKLIREVLINHKSTKNQEDFLAFLEHKPHRYNANNPRFPVGGADGIALVNNKVYWTALSGRELWSIDSHILGDFTKSEKEIEYSIINLGERPACDGLAEDENGNIYFGAFEQLSLIKRDNNGEYHTLIYDERLGWPDGLAYSNGYLYVTLGQWNRLPNFNNGKDLREEPYLIGRVKVE